MGKALLNKTLWGVVSRILCQRLKSPWSVANVNVMGHTATQQPHFSFHFNHGFPMKWRHFNFRRRVPWNFNFCIALGMSFGSFRVPLIPDPFFFFLPSYIIYRRGYFLPGEQRVPPVSWPERPLGHPGHLCPDAASGHRGPPLRLPSQQVSGFKSIEPNCPLSPLSQHAWPVGKGGSFLGSTK